jgi:hypothetical protein
MEHWSVLMQVPVLTSHSFTVWSLLALAKS